MNEVFNIELPKLVFALAKAVDLVNPSINNHHFRVAFIAHQIAADLGLPLLEHSKILKAGALHDIGALTNEERLAALEFELTNPHGHAEQGYMLFQQFPALSNIAQLIRFHHIPWQQGQGAEINGQPVPLGSHILHLADRTAVLIKNNREILGQVPTITAKIKQHSGTKFNPALVEAFCRVAAKDCFWLDLTSSGLEDRLTTLTAAKPLALTPDGLLSFARLFAKIIDFRSPFTAKHSSGVAATAETLAGLCGFSHNEQVKVAAAGYLHDLGKLAVPNSILEKRTRLTHREFNVVKAHAYYTYRILESINAFRDISCWAAYHHEHLDGKGYPFHLSGDDLPLQARILAVADVFTALCEDRPYRSGLTCHAALPILYDMVKQHKLDSKVVAVLAQNIPTVDAARKNAQALSLREYNELLVRQPSVNLFS